MTLSPISCTHPFHMQTPSATKPYLKELEHLLDASLHDMTSDETFSFAREWVVRGEAYLPSSLPNEAASIQLGLRKLFLKLAQLPGNERWHPDFLSLFCHTPEDRQSFAQSLSWGYRKELFRNLDQFHFTGQDKRQLARYIIYGRQSVSTLLNDLQIEDEEVRKQVAIDEIESQLHGEKVACHIANYMLSEQSKEEVALKLVENDPNALLKHWSQFHFASEEARFRILKKLSVREHTSSALYDDISHSEMSRDHLVDLVHDISRRTLSNTFLAALEKFSFDTPQKDHILSEIAEQNPALLFENWPKLSEEQQRLVHDRIPFFGLERLLKTLHETVPLPDFTLLESLLSELSSLNRRVGIPSLFGLSQEPHSLRALLVRIVINGTPQETINLFELLNKHFFSLTPSLMGCLLDPLDTLWPEIDRYISPHPQRSDGFFTIRPIPTMQGVGMLVNLKFGRHLLPPRTIYRICTLGRLSETLKNSIFEGNSQGSLIVYFANRIGGHSSPLFYELKDDQTVRIFLTDSVSTDGPSIYVDSILKDLKDFPLKTEIFIVPFSRQADSVSCPIFAYTDLSSIMREWREHPGMSLVSYFQEGGVVREIVRSDMPVKSLPQFPAHMMRLTQSLSRTEARGREILTSHRREISLADYIREHTFVYYDMGDCHAGFRRGNLAADHKLCTYVARLIGRLIPRSDI